MFDTRREVVGIAGDVQQTDSGFLFAGRIEGPVMTTPTIFLPVAQVPDAFLTMVHTWFRPVWSVRPRPGGRVDGAIAAAVGRVDPWLPVGPDTTMASIVDGATADSRLLLTLVGVFAGVALLLVALGVHGVVAQTVAERRRELGVRLALGATPGGTAGRVALSGVSLAAGGAALGGALAFWTVGLVRRFLWGVSEHDAATYAASTIVVIAVAAVASLVPSLRILRLDPAQTLRE